MRTALLPLTTALALAVQGAAAWSQDACDGALLQRGYELRGEGRDAEALVVIQQAWDRCHTPRALGQLGLAEAATGRWVEANVHLTEALAMASDAWIVRNHDLLAEGQRQVAPHVGRLELYDGVPGAEVLIDGRPVGTLPLREPLRVVAGTALLTVRAPGHMTLNRTVTITAGHVVRERVPMPLTPVEAPAARVAPEEGRGVREARPGPVTTGGGTQRTLAWVAAGGAVALLGGGIAATVVQAGADAYISDAANLCAAAGACAEQRDTQDTAHTLSIVGYVGAGALAVTSAVLFLTAPSGTRARATGALACGLGPGTAGVACAVNF